MSNDNPSIDWDKVIDRLKAGWCKKDFGEYHQREGDVCVVGAVAYAHHLYDWQTAENMVRPSVLPEIVAEQFGERTDGYRGAIGVETFNDHPDTTLDDVILVCEKARGSSWA